MTPQSDRLVAARDETNERLGMQLFPPAPAAFDPTRATAAELRRYGYPDRPDGRLHPRAYQQWLRDVSTPTMTVVPVFGEVPIRQIGTATQGTLPLFPATGTSTNWAGAVVFAETGNAIRSVTGQWTVPDIVIGDSASAWACAQWIGLDGVLPASDDESTFLNSIAQAGTTHAGDSNNDTTFAWFQWLPEKARMISNLTVSPGDVMRCTVSAWSPTTVFVGLMNLTTRVRVALVKEPRQEQRLIGYSAEWILELPEATAFGDQLVDLPPYGAVYFDDCVATLGGGEDVDAGSGELLTMVSNDPMINDFPVEVSIPTMISDTVMRVDFAHTIVEVDERN